MMDFYYLITKDLLLKVDSLSLFIISDNTIPSETSGIVKSILDNSKDLDKLCQPNKYKEEICDKSPTIVIETDSR